MSVVHFGCFCRSCAII